MPPALDGLLRRIARHAPSSLLEPLISRSALPPRPALRLLAALDPRLFDVLSERRVLETFHRARREVPAYRAFLREHGLDPTTIRTLRDFLERVPPTSKETYVRRYPLADRCRRGRLPASGFLDESSGTSGPAVVWVRSPREEEPYLRQMRPLVQYLFRPDPSRPLVVLNGFMQGAWAGGRRFAAHVGGAGIAMNTGPDAGRILATLRDLGPGHTYLIGGYPPFLAELVERGARDGFPWREHTVHLYTGGEGFAEAWRDAVAATLGPGARIYSTYGAIDLELGLAMETPLSVALRRRLEGCAVLRQDLLGVNRRPCFLGQFAPTNVFVHPVPTGAAEAELEITVLGPETVAPKVKYRIGDVGGVVPFSRMCEALGRRGTSPAALVAGDDGWPAALPLPFVFLWGRADGTVSLDGTNIHPEDVGAALLSDPRLAAVLCTSRLEAGSGAMGPRLTVVGELKEGFSPTVELEALAADVVATRLAELSPCYAASLRRDPTLRPLVRLVPHGAGTAASS
jgi:phenylacetate-CoA ligase